MKRIPTDMLPGTKFQTNNYGELEIIEYINALNVVVMFSDTGYVTKARAGDIRRVDVKDKLKPSVCGVGCVGDGEHKPSHKGKITKTYDLWSSMLRRCYDPLTQERQPTYKECRVDVRWHNFQNFANDIKKLPGYDSLISGENYALDKDTLFSGCKLYSRYTCQFISAADNVIEANAKHYTFVSPWGETVNVYNLSEFCRNNNLHDGHMSNVHSGKASHHKGWKKHA